MMPLVHSYPMCYRTHDPLIYRAMPSWFVAVTQFKDDMIKQADKINWVPNTLERPFWQLDCRRKGLEYCPKSFWVTRYPFGNNEETKESIVISSAAELEKYAGRPLDDLHMDKIDDIKSLLHRSWCLKRVP